MEFDPSNDFSIPQNILNDIDEDAIWKIPGLTPLDPTWNSTQEMTSAPPKTFKLTKINMQFEKLWGLTPPIWPYITFDYRNDFSSLENMVT